MLKSERGQEGWRVSVNNVSKGQSIKGSSRVLLNYKLYLSTVVYNGEQMLCGF